MPRDALEHGARTIVTRLREAGHEAVYAGGCVRDRVMGRDPVDYDIATSAPPDAVRGLFAKTIPVGEQFGVVLVLCDGCEYQVATFRGEGAYLDGRHPAAVAFTDMRTDAERRDFTINGMFYDPLDERVIDYVGGRDDLERKIIRTIGDPHERFREDHLRLVRAVRFASSLGFTLDAATQQALSDCAPLIQSVSAERVRDELTTLLVRAHPRRGMELLDETGLLEHIVPEVVAMHGVEQPPEFHPEGDVWIHTMIMLDEMPENPPPELALAVLLHDIGKPPTQTFADRIRFNRHCEVGMRMTDAVLERLRFSRKQRAVVGELVRDHLKFKDVPKMKESTLKRFLRGEHFDLHLELHRIDCMGSHQDLSAYEFCKEKLAEFRAADAEAVLRPKPLVTGHDLIEEGYVPGPEFSRILTAVEDAQLEGRVRSRDDALRLVHEQFPQTG